MKKTHLILIGIGTLLAAAPNGMVRPACADVVMSYRDPAYQWVYKSVDDLQRAGIVIGYPDGTYSSIRSMTRMEMATSVSRLIVLLNTDYLPSNSRGLAAARADLHSKIDNNAVALDALLQLVDGFAPELKLLGIDVPAAQQDLYVLMDKLEVSGETEGQKSFDSAGVPPNHWAYQAVETLYECGIMIGYPAGPY